MNPSSEKLENSQNPSAMARYMKYVNPKVYVVIIKLFFLSLYEAYLLGSKNQ
jgi:hypothetical protein